ncbi:MAG: hypothetical protein GF311_27220 [Candidatus Lokiarchaeota archaeon]|nr:hypothetical protein [Candidatus Lokiarchaeota archaeon]
MKKVSFRIDEKLLSEKMDLGGFTSYSAFLREAVEKYNPSPHSSITSETLDHFRSQIEEIHTMLKDLEASDTLTRLTPPKAYNSLSTPEQTSLPPGPPSKNTKNTKNIMNSKPITKPKIKPTQKGQFSSFNERSLGEVSPRTAMLAELKHKFSECSDVVRELLVSVPENEQKISKFINYRFNKKAET